MTGEIVFRVPGIIRGDVLFFKCLCDRETGIPVPPGISACMGLDAVTKCNCRRRVLVWIQGAIR